MRRTDCEGGSPRVRYTTARRRLGHVSASFYAGAAFRYRLAEQRKRRTEKTLQEGGLGSAPGKDPKSEQFVASASQDPFMMARLAVQEGVELLNGKKPAKDPLLMDSKLITRDNVGDYKGWTSAR